MPRGATARAVAVENIDLILTLHITLRQAHMLISAVDAYATEAGDTTYQDARDLNVAVGTAVERAKGRARRAAQANQPERMAE